jgi:hypothetical protein
MKDKDKDSLMRDCYYIITRNFTKTVNRFVVFKSEGKSIEIHSCAGNRSKFIDMMIEYFVGTEEYEKCEKLLKLRELIEMSGD